MPLEELNLCGCASVSEEGLCALVTGKPLARLWLYWVSLTDGILPTLKKLPLVILSVSGDGFSESGLEGLVRAVPTIEEVLWLCGPLSKTFQGQANFA